MKNVLNRKIITELAQGIDGLSLQPWNAARALAPVFYKEAEKRGADSHFLSIIGSWGDTLDDEKVLELIKEAGKNQVMFDKTFTPGITSGCIHGLELITAFFFGAMLTMCVVLFISN